MTTADDTTDNGSGTPDANAAFHAYDRAWTTADDTERLRLLRTAVTEDVLWQDPFTDLHGLPALSDFIGAFVGSGRRLVTIGGWQQHHAYGRFRWVALDPQGEVFAEGEDVATVTSSGTLGRFMVFAALVDKP
jgi:hypothetical protein